MTKQDQIAGVLDRYVTGFPRCHSPYRQSLGRYGLAAGPRPSAEELARQLLAIAEFRAVQLGTWLGTTDGQVISEAVEMVLPMFYTEDVALLVEALKLAAAMQQRGGRQKVLVSSGIAFAAVGAGYLATRDA